MVGVCSPILRFCGTAMSLLTLLFTNLEAIRMVTLHLPFSTL